MSETRIFYGILFLLIAFVCFMFGFYLMFTETSYVLDYNLTFFNTVSISMVVLIDKLSVMLLSLVFIITSMIITYSEEYMASEKSLTWFIILIALFVCSMMLFVLSPNLLSILLGWDGLGLISYVLVIYYQNMKSYNAGMLTALTNRVGDVAIIISIAYMFHYGSWNCLLYLDFFKDMNMSIISILIVIAALTKSAQIPFSSWLPAAMAAPTPVSALVHSSTLVAAGVYLLIRFHSLFSPGLLKFLLFISLMTTLMSSIAALFEFDLKKIIALSTLSQLGLMISTLALGEWELSFFHMMIHALFKALLFMCAGVVIHVFNNTQDIRSMGGLIYLMPLTCVFFNISNFSLCGLPFFSLFYSKDLMMDIVFMKPLSLFIYASFYLSVGLTACYSVRLSYYLMIGDFNYLVLHKTYDTMEEMFKSMCVLFCFVIFSGSVLSWLMFSTPYYVCLPQELKLGTPFAIFLGIWLGYGFSELYLNYTVKSMVMDKLSWFCANMWNMPILFSYGVSHPISHLGGLCIKSFDQGWLEYYGACNLFMKWKEMSQILQLLSKNYFIIYLGLAMTWFITLFVWVNFF